MGDSQRFEALASFVETRVPNKLAKIADVAAGKGQLSLALKRRGYKNITAFEPHPRQKLQGIQLKACNFVGGDFDVILGMHPDQATDVILDEGSKSKARVILVPCCVLPHRWQFSIVPQASHNQIRTPLHRQDGSYHAWLKHLVEQSKRRGLLLQQTILPISGRNVVLYGRC